ncbi:MAG TPA: transcription antitermination factor NusB [Usitatibacteraceae bacterium]
MKSARRRSREFALQALYQWQLAGQSFGDIEKQYADAEGFAKADVLLFQLLVKSTIKNSEALSVQLTPHLDRPWAEVSPIERGIMLLGAIELTQMPETPYRVIINEAIELAKSFGGTDGHKYVNGVLDKLAAVVRADEIAYQNEHPSPRKSRADSKIKTDAPAPVVTVKVRRMSKA